MRTTISVNPYISGISVFLISIIVLTACSSPLFVRNTKGRSWKEDSTGYVFYANKPAALSIQFYGDYKLTAPSPRPTRTEKKQLSSIVPSFFTGRPKEILLQGKTVIPPFFITRVLRFPSQNISDSSFIQAGFQRYSKSLHPFWHKIVRANGITTGQFIVHANDRFIYFLVDIKDKGNPSDDNYNAEAMLGEYAEIIDQSHFE